MTVNELEHIMKDDIPFVSFMGKERKTMQVLEMCQEENNRRITRETYLVLFGITKDNYKEMIGLKNKLKGA